MKRRARSGGFIAESRDAGLQRAFEERAVRKAHADRYNITSGYVFFVPGMNEWRVQGPDAGGDFFTAHYTVAPDGTIEFTGNW